MNLAILHFTHFVTYFLVTTRVYGVVNKKLYVHMDGLRCPGAYRVFMKSVYSKTFCVCMCSVNRACLGVEYRSTGNLCHGCENIYEVNPATASETSSTYFLDSGKYEFILHTEPQKEKKKKSQF